jgi:hypothetical protein
VDRAAAETWIRDRVDPVAPIEILHERPWATVARVPVDDGVAWFKACGPFQAFEPRLTASLFARWPDLIVEVIAHDEDRAWLLLRDAGTQLRELGNPPELWLDVLPRYAELQRGEVERVGDHVAHGVPDLRLETLPGGFDELLREELPLEDAEIDELRRWAPRFGERCRELAALGVPETIQHDDLHMNNLFASARGLRIVDWGDASVSHPFASLVVTFRFLEERTGLAPGDPWFERLRDAYLEPWGGRTMRGAFDLAFVVGGFARAIAYLPMRGTMSGERRRSFDEDLAIVLRRALAAVPDSELER